MLDPSSGVASCVKPLAFEGSYRDSSQPGCKRLFETWDADELRAWGFEFWDSWLRALGSGRYWA